MAVIAIGVRSPAAVIVAVIVSGAFIGINNTLTTQAVMLVSPVERPVASSAYGFVRFIGGGLAPYAAGKLAEATDLGVPFFVGGVTFVLAIFVLATGRRLLDAAEATSATEAPAAGPALDPVGRLAATGSRPAIVAAGADADAVVDAAALTRAAPGRVVLIGPDPEPDESTADSAGARPADRPGMITASHSGHRPG
jgi:ACDE family multidrug resistance protein